MTFGVLRYNGTDNLGDEIQSLAAMGLIPSPRYHLNRDDLGREGDRIEDPYVSMILNGWFGQWPENWPPSKKIRPLLISMHITKEAVMSKHNLHPHEFMLAPGLVKYFNQHGPVGTRDLATLELLKNAGVDAYFSGCLTLTLERPAVRRNDELIVLNDLPEAFLPHIRGRAHKQILQTSHIGFPILDKMERLHRARELLALYASASCVVTTRLHCALPCLAMGTPVLLLNIAADSYRFAGLQELVHNCTPKDFITSAFQYNINNPPENKQDHLPLRAGLLARVASFVSLDGSGEWAPHPDHPSETDRQAALQLIANPPVAGLVS